MDENQNDSFRCEALPDGRVQFSITRAGEVIGGIEVPAEKVADVVVALLSAAAAAGKMAGAAMTAKVGDALFDVPTASPTGLGLMQGKLINSSALMLQFGPAKVALRLADKEFAQLGQALATMTGAQGVTQ